MKLLLILLLFIPVAAQSPTRINGELAKQLQTIAESQKKLSDEYVRLENVKLTIKYRACLEAKFDAEKCDTVDIAADKDGFVFQPKPVEKKP